MKSLKFASLLVMLMVFNTGVAQAYTQDIQRRQTDAAKMLHKLGRGITNVLTCWVEIPRNIAMEWEETDPATGTILGAVKGTGWGFARFCTGVYESFTFLLPVPSGYQYMMEPEFVITDIWGDPIPGVSEPGLNDPTHSGNTPIYPQRFNF